VQSQNYDAIVVGSGISGGWAAKELTEKGSACCCSSAAEQSSTSKTTLIPQGPLGLSPSRQAHESEGGGLPGVEARLPLNKTNLDWWASDQESPYTEVKRFDWYRGYHVGGRSLMWGRQSYRWSDFDSRRTRARASVSIGRSATPTSPPGTTTSTGTPGFPDRKKGWRNFPTDSFNRRCRSTARRVDRRTAQAAFRRAAGESSPGRTRTSRSAAGSRAVSVLQRVAAGLSVRGYSAPSLRRCRRQSRRDG